MSSLKSKKAILASARLYVVLDSAVADFEKLFVILKQTVYAGTKIVQLRSKNGSAREILSFVKKALPITKGQALFVMNDRVDLARVGGCDGVHLGQEDMSVKDARLILGYDKLVGVSCQALSQVGLAQKQGADYIGFGSVFKTKTKPERNGLNLDLVSLVSRQSKVPVFFIGGITLRNVSRVVAQGGQRVAVTRAICESKDVAASTRSFLKKFSQVNLSSQGASSLRAQDYS